MIKLNLEQRVRRLENLVAESTLSEKDFAQMEIEDIITDMIHMHSKRILSKIRADVNSKRDVVMAIIDEIITNQNDAYSYFMSTCDSEDDLYDCEELDDMILDTVQSLSM